jgi:hypothetical protein
MANKEIEAALDSLFEKANEVVTSLGEEFSTEDFRVRIAQRSQVAYTKLADLCTDKTNTFGVAHQHISSRLKKLAAGMGYVVSGKKSQPDTFGTLQQYDVFKKV